MRSIVAVAALAAAFTVQAQQFPSRPVRFITVSTPGTDIITRIMATDMAAQLGQQVVVENRPGGSGLVGADAGAKSAPDGYSVLFATSGTMLTNHFVIAKMPFDTFRDFTPIAMVSTSPSVLVVSP